MTTEDGTIVLFSSPLRLKETDEPLRPKLFVADATGTIRLFEQGSTGLVAADLSADGSTLAVSSTQPDLAEIRPAAGAPIGASGVVRLSDNGAHAVAISVAGSTVIDVVSGAATKFDVGSLAALPSQGARIVANDGRVIAVSAGDKARLIVIPANGRWRAVSTAVTPAVAVTNADMTLIAYQTATGDAIRLLYGTDGNDVELVAAREGCRQPILTADGGTLLFLSAANWDARNSSGQPQAWMLHTDGSELHQLTSDPAGVAEAAISADGSVVWAVTYSGRMLRVDTATREVKEIAGRTPLIEPFTAVRGSLVFVRGRGLSDMLTIGRRSVPVVFASPAEVRFQTPWDAQGGDIAVNAENTPFDTAQPYMPSVTPTDIGPQFLAAAHGDFHGVVSDSDPAVPGEIVNLYMTGLGPVTPQVPTGVAGPANPPAVVANSLTWTTVDKSGASAPAEILFAGLAPGILGVYQVSLRLPDAIAPPLCIQVAGQSSCLAVRSSQ